jgi:recombination protein RecT
MTDAKQRNQMIVQTVFEDKINLLNGAMNGSRNLTPEKLKSTLIQAAVRQPQIWDCTQQSIFETVLLAARLDVDPSGHHNGAHFVPFWDTTKGVRELKLMLGYNAMIDLATRDKRITSFTTGVIYDDEEHEIVRGTCPRIHHVPSTRDRKTDEPIKWAYAIAWFPTGQFEMEVMSLAEVQAIRKKSKQSDGAPWKYAFPEMAKKTVLRRLIKRLPLNPNAAIAIEQSDEADGFEFAGRRPVANEAAEKFLDSLPGRDAQDKPANQDEPTDEQLASQPAFDPDELPMF